MNRLDKLFKDQLLKHEEIPTRQAWDQIHGGLAANRRRALVKRLAIAASILLFATVGYIGYRSLDSLTIKKDQIVAKNIDDIANSEEQPISKPEEVIIEINNSNENAEEPTIKIKDQQQDRAQVKSVDKIVEEPLELDLPFEKIEAKMPILRENESDEDGVEQESIIDEPKEVIEEPILSEPAKEILLAKNNAIDEVEEGLEIKDKKKTYIQVKIIYKADRNSALISSGKKTFINKGIDKLTKFSNEHLLTEDRKTKLRNTKEDLLALNFGKLLNKSNKEGS